MSTPDQPSTPPLTRRQLREMRNTGVTPVIPPTTEPDETPADESDRAVETPEADVSAPATPVEEARPVRPSAPLPHASVPAPVHTAPVPDSHVDLGAVPLTRRQARQQERIRTASVPVITPDIAGAATPASATVTSVVERSSWAPPSEEDAAGAEPRTAEQVAEEAVADESVAEQPAAHEQASQTRDAAPQVDAGRSFEELLAEAALAEEEKAPAAPEPVEAAPERPVLNPAFGARVLAGDAKAPEPAASFEQLLTRDTSTTGSVSAPHALIMTQTSAPLIAPIAGTGEVLVTGTFALPEGLGSTGHAVGTADGREVDAILVDGELPAHSSPTPIAASAAVSTIKSSADVIQPPTPEKGGKLMLSLAITAGVLALALVGVLVYALASGVIS